MLTKDLQEKINHMKFCTYCGSPVAKGHGWSAVGMCSEHLQTWEEDIKYGLHKRNRLKELQMIIESNKSGNQLIIELI